jgi:hypothetical protein
MRDAASLPEAQPALPVDVTHVWVTSTLVERPEHEMVAGPRLVVPRQASERRVVARHLPPNAGSGARTEGRSGMSVGPDHAPGSATSDSTQRTEQRARTTTSAGPRPHRAAPRRLLGRGRLGRYGRSPNGGWATQLPGRQWPRVRRCSHEQIGGDRSCRAVLHSR